MAGPADGDVGGDRQIQAMVRARRFYRQPRQPVLIEIMADLIEIKGQPGIVCLNLVTIATNVLRAVGDNTWHSVDPVGPEVETRDLIILQYFVDSGLQRMIRNRGKRIGNMLLNEVRHLAKLGLPAG